MFGRKAHLGQNFLHLFAALFAGLVHVVDVQTLADDILHLLAGVQGRHGVLKDHLHLGAQRIVLHAAQPAADILPIKGDLSGSGVIQADDAAANGGLAGAGLAHDGHELAFFDFHGDVVCSLYRGVTHLVILAHLIKLDQSAHAFLLCQPR